LLSVKLAEEATYVSGCLSNGIKAYQMAREVTKWLIKRQTSFRLI
jgi:hypothetical protein